MPENDGRRSFEDDVIARLVRIETLNSAANTQASDHETRLRGLERSSGRLFGIAGAAGMFSGFLTDIIYHSVQVHL